MADIWTVRIDGASRGNPGAAAYAVVIERPGEPVYEEAQCIGRTTNNVAEYTALVRALEQAAKLGGQRLDVISDSELLVKQMNGEYRVKSAELKELQAAAQKLANGFEEVTYRHVRRADNKRADALCNAALDGKIGPPIDELPAPAAPASTPTAPPAARGDVRRQVVGCLRRAAHEWAKGDPTWPDPERIWDELWDIVSGAVGRLPRED